MPFKARGSVSFILLCFLMLPTRAQLATSLIHRSGMVLQRGEDIPLWGQTEGGALVFAELNGLKDSTMADPDGYWEIVLPAMGEGGPYEPVVRSGEDSLVYSDEYLGDVWLASGQSNMAMELKECDNATDEIAAADNQEIRQFLVTKSLGTYPREELPESMRSKLDLERKNFIGFLAHDVFEILPEVVSYDKDADIYSMNYLRIIPILVEAIKEQQTPVSYTHLTLPTTCNLCRSRWSPYH